jgi:hypothetical protein
LSADRTSVPSPGDQGGTQVDYDIRSPEGGLRQQVDAYLAGVQQYLDLTISSGRGHRVAVRLFPNRDTVHQDTARANLVHIFGGTCYRLVDAEVTGPALICSGRVNLEVTTAPLETGKLHVLFEKGDPL